MSQETKKPRRKAIRINDASFSPLDELNEYLELGFTVLMSVQVSPSITYIILER